MRTHFLTAVVVNIARLVFPKKTTMSPLLQRVIVIAVVCIIIVLLGLASR